MFCTKCGAEFEVFDASATVMRCSRIGCGAAFIVRQAKGFARIKEDRLDAGRSADKVGHCGLRSRGRQPLYPGYSGQRLRICA